MTVELSFQAHRPADANAADQPSNPVAQNVGAVECVFYEARVAGPRENLAYCRPIRALDAVRAIPFGIFRNHYAALVRRDRPRAADPAFLSKHIGTKRGLIRIAPLLKAYRIDGKIERFAGGGRVVAEVPQAQTVVAIDRLRGLGVGVELDAHLAEIVAEQHADLTANGRGVETWDPGLRHA